MAVRAPVRHRYPAPVGDVLVTLTRGLFNALHPVSWPPTSDYP